MNQKPTSEITLAKCPRRGDKKRSTTIPPKNIARLSSPICNSPDYLAYKAQKAFDYGVFRAMMVGGLGGDKFIPTRGKEMITLIFGAIRLVCLGEGVDPTSFRLLSFGEDIYGGWELTCEALATDKLCPSITASLQRLLSPHTESRQNDADDASCGNMLLDELWNGSLGLWWYKTWYYARQRTSRLSNSLVKLGPGLEEFSPEEQGSLQALISGVAQMQPIVEDAFSN